MNIELYSNRTVMRPFAEPDALELLALFRDPGVRRYLLDDSLVTLEWVRDEIQTSSERFTRNGSGLWSVRLKHEEAIAGFVGFREVFDPPQLQLLYGLLPDYWGMGFATEVAARLCTEAFDNLGFETVKAATDTPNSASIRVLTRLGFKLVPDEQSSGTLFYTLNGEQWRGRS